MDDAFRMAAARAGRAARDPRLAFPRMTESQIQMAVMGHLRARAGRDVVAWHVPNGGGRSKAEAGRFKAEGVVPGIPDICLLMQGRFYGLELKADKGRPSAAQIAMHDRLRAAGATVAVVWGLDAALAQLEQWGVLK